MKTLGLFLFLFSIVLATATYTRAQGAKEVIVANTSAAPVPVRSADDPARRAFQVGFEPNSGNTVTTPAGKIFVVEHVSGSFRLGTTSGSTNPCRFFQLSLPVSGIAGPPESIELIPTIMGTAPSVSNDITFLSLSQPMKFYIRQNTEIGGVSYSISGGCIVSPLLNSRIVLSGYLVDM